MLPIILFIIIPSYYSFLMVESGQIDFHTLRFYITTKQ